MIEKLPNVDSWDRLIDYICSRGIASRHCAEEMLSLINAPPHLKGLQIVCTHLLQILPRIDFIAKSEGSLFSSLRSQIDTWMRIASVVSKEEEHSQSSSLYGEYTGSYSLYAAMWHSPHKTDLVEKYFDLMAILCVALKKLRFQEAKGESYPCSKYNATLCARQLTKQKYEAELRCLPSKCSSLREYFSELKKEKDQFYHDIWVLLDYAINGKAGIRRMSDGRTRIPKVTILAEDPPDEDGVDAQPVQRIQLPESAEKQRAARKTLVSPAEYDEGRASFQFSTRKLSPEAGDRQTARQDAFESRKLSKWLAIKNQLLPGRWDVLTPYETAVFLEAVQDLMKEKRIVNV
ncbi:MAG: hypothetical protein ABSA86_02560, partial [Oryzomonas sp.]